MAAESAQSSSASGPSYDPGRRRQALRKQRERGCSIYLPAEALLRAGVALDGPPPFYRVWGAPRGRLVVQLYAKP